MNFARASHSFKAEQDYELTLSQNDVIAAVEIVDESWCKGILVTNGAIGYVPVAFVEFFQPESVVATDELDTGQLDDLNFSIGDIIYRLSRVDENWSIGFTNGRTGLYPNLYVAPRTNKGLDSPKDKLSPYANSQMFAPGPTDPVYANFPVTNEHTKDSNLSQFDHLEPLSPEFDHLDDTGDMLRQLEKELELNEARLKSFDIKPSEEITTSQVISESQIRKQDIKLNLELDSVIGNLEENLGDFDNRLVTPVYANGPQTHIYNLDKPKPLEYNNIETTVPSNEKSEKNAIKTELKLEKALGKLEKKYQPSSKLDVYEGNKSKQGQTNKPQPAVKRKLPKTPEKAFSQPNLIMSKIAIQNSRKLPNAKPHIPSPFTKPIKVLPTLDQHDPMGSSGGPIPKRIAPPPPANQNPLSVDVTQSLCDMRQRTNQNAEYPPSEYSFKTDSFCTLTPSLIEEQIRLSPPLTPPNHYPQPFRRVKSSNEDINLFPNIPRQSPVAKKSDFSPNIKKVNTHKKVTIRSRSLGSCSSDDSRKSPIDLESIEDPFTGGEQRSSRRRTVNGLTSFSSPVSSTKQRHFPQSEIDLNEYPGVIELQQQINEIERKLEVEEKMHSCLQTMLQVVTGCDAAKEEQLEVRQVACEHEIQELQNKLQILKGEKDTIFTDQVNESPNFSSPYSTPKRSKNGSPDRVMQSIAAIDTQLEAEERVLIGLESQLEIPLDPVVRQEVLCKIQQTQSKIQILQIELQNRKATIATSQDPRLTRLEHRQYVLDEIVQTERDFSKHMYLTCTYVLQACRDANISQMEMNILFGNMEAISKVSEVLLVGLQDTLRNVIEKQTIGLCFLMNARDLKDTYANYCRNLDEALTLLDKFDEEHPIHGVLEYGLSQIRSHVQCWDLPSILIKPMQRILKYPLLLGDLVKYTEDDHPDKKHLISASKLMGEVANQINEVKRRKDLVLKYHVNEQGLKSKLENMNWHSVIKKTRRVNQIILKSAGINTSTVDEVFQAEERRFKELEKTLKSVVKSITTLVTYMQEGLDNRLIVCEGLTELCNGKDLQCVTAYNKVYRQTISEQIFPQLSDSLNLRVLQPIQNLLGLFQGPLHLIQKRNDKLLDYDACLNKAEKTRDVMKLKAMKDELQLAKLNYDALNQQLLDDIPKFCSMAEDYLQKCLSALIHSISGFYTRMELAFKKIAKPLPSDLSEIEKVHLEKLHRACCAMCNLHFIPASFSVVRINRLPAKPDVIGPIRPLRPIAGVGLNSQPQRNMNLFSNSNLSSPQSKDYIVKHQYISTNAIELTVNPGDIIKVIEPHDTVGNTEWWFVLLGNQTGYVPASYLAECTEDELARMEELETEPRYAKAAEEFYFSEYPFEARENIEVSLTEGQVVSVIRRNDMEGNTEWWLIEANDKIGYVPCSYLVPIEANC
ncbi:hypothetical protein LOD99_9968 [Oopsacas minuta]|uniref:Dynamin-binding protein n=1 Tax=Oopsacas minuta TaxID=111878 RepID=A0AAV7KKB5_9METZ|nr:hypothetical protein LOD99_9968 [Oopsacas minuta]